MTNTTLSTSNQQSVGTATALNTQITNGATTAVEAVFLNNISDTSPVTIMGSSLTIDGEGFTLTGSSTTAGLVVGNGSAVSVGDLNINDGGAGAISLGTGSEVIFLPSSTPNGATNLGIIAGAITGSGSSTGAVVVGSNSDVAPADVPLVLDAVNTYMGATLIYDQVDLGTNGSIATSNAVNLEKSFSVLDISGAQSAAGAPVTETVNNLSGVAGSAVYLGLNGLTIVESGTTSFAGVIADSAATNNYVTSGKVSISEAAGDTYTLTAIQTYTGSTKVLSGTLAITQAAALEDSSNVSLKASGATLDVSGVTGPTTVLITELTGVAGSKVVLGGNSLQVTENAVAASFSGVISGSGGLTLNGPYELSLAGANTYTGVTTIDSGATLGISGAGSLASSEVTGAGNFDISGATAPVTVTDLDTSGKVTLGANTLILAGTSSPNGVISGNGALQVGTASATATATLSTSETYTGATKVYGTLTVESGASIADSSNVSLKSGTASVTFDSNDASINELTGVTGSQVIFDGQLTVTEDGAAATFAGTLSGGDLIVAAAATGTTYALTLSNVNGLSDTDIEKGATLDLVGSGTLGSGFVEIDGVLDISGAGGGTVTELTLDGFAGAGSLVLGANIVNFDDSTFNTRTFSGSISGAGGLEVMDGYLTLTGSDTYTGVTQIDGDGNLTIASALATSSIVDNGSLTIGVGGVSAATITVSQVISGDGYLDFSGGSQEQPFTTTLTAASSFTGTYEVEEYNTLVLSGAGSLNAASYVNNYGTIDISGANGTAIFSNYDDDTGAKIILGATSAIFEGANGYADATVISGSGSVQVGESSDTTPAYLEFGEAQAYTGSTIIYGELDLFSAGSVTASSNVSLKASGADFDVSSFDETTATPAVAINTLTGVAGSFINLGDNTLDVTQKTAASFSGVIQDGTLGDHGSLIVDGTAILTLAGANSYTGSTTIDKGAEIALSGGGSFNDSEGVTLNGTLDISGAVGGTQVVSGPATITLYGVSGAGTLILGNNIANFTGDDYYYFTGTISGAGQVQVSNDTFLDLAGSNTYTGLTTVNDNSTLNLGSALHSSGIVLSTGNSGLYVGDSDEAAVTVSQVISGAGYVDIEDGYSVSDGGIPFTATFTKANTYTGNTRVYEYNTLVLSGAGSIADSADVSNYGGTVDISAASAPVVLNNYGDEDYATSVLNLGANTVIFLGTDNYSGYEGGVISGTGSVQVGTSTATTAVLELYGVQAYSGSTIVYGELEVEGANAIAASANVSLKDSSAILALEVGGAATVDINTLTGVTGSKVEMSFGPFSDSLDVTQKTAASFSGVISGSGGLTIDAAGTAALTLGAANTYTGVTTDNGSLTLGIAGAIADSSAVIVNGTLTLGVASTVKELSGTGTISLGTFALTDALASVGSHDTFSGVISGSGSLTETGFLGGTTNLPGSASTTTSSSLTLSGASTFTGGITIEGGTVEIAGAGSAGTGAITFADVSSSTPADAGILKIDNAALTGAGTASESFANTIAGVSAQDVIDLTGLAYDNVPGPAVGGSLHFNAATGQLDVTEGNVTVALTIQGLNASTAANYHVYEDAHGGTYLTQIIPGDNTHYHP